MLMSPKQEETAASSCLILATPMSVQ